MPEGFVNIAFCWKKLYFPTVDSWPFSNFQWWLGNLNHCDKKAFWIYWRWYKSEKKSLEISPPFEKPMAWIVRQLFFECKNWFKLKYRPGSIRKKSTTSLPKCQRASQTVPFVEKNCIFQPSILATQPPAIYPSK